MKELLALVSGLHGKTPRDIDRSFAQIDRVLDGAVYDPKVIGGHGGSLTADQLYVNTKITDLVSKAEMEQFDYRREQEKHEVVNVFFGPMKQYFGIRASVLTFNSAVLLVSSLAGLFLLYFILRYQVSVRSN